MAISSNALFHFTDTYENLLSIIKNRFLMSYCWEEKLLFNQKAEGAVPMISFCDLPLSQAINHLQYGEYAIGMNKEWALYHRLNPVMYLEKDSVLTEIYKEAFIALSNFSQTQKDNNYHKVVRFLLEFDRFSKNFEGDLIRDNNIQTNFRFYNEREWRFVPNLYEKGFKPRMDKEEYEAFKSKNPIKPHIRDIFLDFGPNDIKYIMLRNSDLIPMFIDFITLLPNFGSREQKQIFFTKIITYDQIKSDL